MALLFGLLGKIPLLVWALAAALAYGQVQKWSAERAGLKLKERLAAEAISREEELRRQLVEQDRVLKKQQESAVLGQRARDAEQVARVGAERAVSELQHRAREAAARACTPSPAATADGATGEDGATVLADVLGRLARAGGERAAALGEARARGAECERSYDALTPP
jgi:Protein of unknown function (DUF2514)